MPKGYAVLVDTLSTKVVLYKTKIVDFDHVNKILTLNSGSWRTHHTKKCINLALSSTCYKVFQRDFTWYVTDGLTITEFNDNMQLPIAA